MNPFAKGHPVRRLFDGTEADLRRLFRDGHPDLPDLTTIEEIMIARNHVIMTTVRLTGGASCGFKGQVLNKEQDVSELYSRLPLRPGAMPITVVKIRGQATPSGFREFLFESVSKVFRKCLVWLKANNPLYRDIFINEDVLTQIETVGEDEMLSQFSTIEEGEDDEEDEDEDDEEGDEEPDRGPDQGNDLEGGDDDDVVDRLERGYLALPIFPRDNQAVSTAQGLRERYAEAPLNHVPHNETGTTFNDYSTSSLQAMAFPTLFFLTELMAMLRSKTATGRSP
jgi:hypothetical protein